MLFASSAIGTSHLVLSTRAGAHHGLIFIWIILAALLLKYPFYEFAPRYSVATGKTLIQGYRDQGIWALSIFFFIITIEMFFVTCAVGAVSAGLLSVTLGLTISQTYIYCVLMLVTALILLIGKYRLLESLIKIISIVLVITIGIIFVAVLINGPIDPSPEFEPTPLLHGAGLALLVSMLGWMPNGMEGSTMHSVWIIENDRVDGVKIDLKNALLDFRIGYFMTAFLALMFLVIGAYINYGSGQLLDGNSMQFSTKLMNLFTSALGKWSYTVLAIAAFGTIYGTLITVWDAFARCFIASIFSFKQIQIKDKNRFNQIGYMIMIPIIGFGGSLLFSFFTSSVIKMLEFATIVSFLLSPILAWLNWKAIRSAEVGAEFQPPKWLNLLAGLGLLSMVLFALYYAVSQLGIFY